MKKKGHITLSQIGAALLTIALAISTSVAGAGGAVASADSDGDANLQGLTANLDERHDIDEILSAIVPWEPPTNYVNSDAQILNLELDNFGGIWVDESGGYPVVTIAVVPTATGETYDVAEYIVESLLEAVEAGKLYHAAAEALESDNAVIETVEVRYEFEQLVEWQRQLRTLFTQGLITTLDADEEQNSVTIGISDPANYEPVLAYALELGIPSDAIRVIEIRISVTGLRDPIRPVVGGQQISFPRFIVGSVGTSIGASNCTLGIPTRVLNVVGQPTGYLTNSHCSIDMASVDNVFHWQPTIPFGALWNTSNRMGVEVLDPSPFTGNPFGEQALACPAGRRCRLGDIAFGLFEPDFANTPPGFIARPSSLGTLAWNGADRFRVTSVAVPSGEVHAVGRTSGMTTGRVINTCVSVAHTEGIPYYFPCQYWATYSSQPGDSGGPVFRVTNSPAVNDVAFVGLNWGSLHFPDGSFFAGIISPWYTSAREFLPHIIGVCADGFGC